MARKRMISPEIWESQSFGELSILGKILFIGMISQADDDGKGILSAQFLKSRILPYDELRIAEVDKALKEIGHKTSVKYYEVKGKRYYILENWQKWQLINRPTQSKLPDPPMDCGEGGDIRSGDSLTEDSLNIHGVVNEDSLLIEEKGIERNRKEEREARTHTLTREETSLLNNYSINVDVTEVAEGTDIKLLAEKVMASPYLKQWKFLSKYLKYYDKIISGYYDAYDAEKRATIDKTGESYQRHEYSEKEINKAFISFN